jgi:hypothetical protein
MTSSDADDLIQAADLLQLIDLCCQGDLEKLGQKPLARLSAVNLIRSQERLPQSTMGYGKALQILLHNVIAEWACRESNGREQVYRLLRHRMAGHSQKSICQELQLSESGLYRLQRDHVLPALRSRIWEQENSAQAQLELHHALRNVPPRTYSRLFGVTEKLKQLNALLQDEKGAGVVCLHGLGGLGKTALATAACRELAQQKRIEEVIWIRAVQRRSTWRSAQEPSDKELTSCVLFEEIVQQLELSHLNDLSPAERLKNLRALLAQHRTILVVDNLETAVDLEPLFTGLCEWVGRSKIVITSRRRLVEHVPVHTISLDELSWSDSKSLLRHEAEVRGLSEVSAAAEDLLHTIYAVTGGNPQALKLVIGQCCSRPLTRILAELKAVRGTADEFYGDIYRNSWNQLSADAQRLLLSMSLLPSSGGSWDELQLASGIERCTRLATVVEELVNASLLLAVGLVEKRYTIHRLTYHFIQAQLLNRSASAHAQSRPGD